MFGIIYCISIILSYGVLQYFNYKYVITSRVLWYLSIIAIIPAINTIALLIDVLGIFMGYNQQESFDYLDESINDFLNNYYD